MNGHRRGRDGFAIMVMAALVVGCGSTPQPPSAATEPGAERVTPVPPTPVPNTSSWPTDAPSPTSSVAGPDLVGRLGCGQGSEIDVAADVLRQPAEAELAQTVEAQALRAFVTTPDATQMGYPTLGWRVAGTSATRIDFLAPGRNGWYYVSVEDIEDQGGWQAWEYGRCDLQVVLPEGIGFASWALGPDPPAPDATGLTVLATEVACASGKPMAGRLLAPIVLYAPEAVTIAIVVRQRPGVQECQGNSPEPVLVDLSEPLGGRALFDGSSYPAQQRN